MIASASLREQRVEDFADHTLACVGQLVDAFELLLNLRRRPALGGLDVRAHQVFDADAERLRDHGQRRDLDATVAINGVAISHCH